MTMITYTHIKDRADENDLTEILLKSWLLSLTTRVYYTVHTSGRCHFFFVEIYFQIIIILWIWYLHYNIKYVRSVSGEIYSLNSYDATLYINKKTYTVNICMYRYTVLLPLPVLLWPSYIIILKCYLEWEFLFETI